MCELLNDAQLDAYFQRIDLDRPAVQSIESLNALLYHHLTHIPFDSLDVWGAGLCPSLAVQDIYQKIVVNKRGGYCFEQNTLFRVVLDSVGYQAYQAVACLLNEDYTPHPPAHNVVICVLDGKKYLLDVGFGGPVPYKAVELCPGQCDSFLLHQKEDLFILEREDQDGIHPFIQFRDIPAEITDLIPLNFYISQNPESHFRHIIHLNQRMSDGSVYVLNGKEFKIHRKGEVEERTIGSVTELKQILRDYYGIDPATCLLRDTL